MLPFLPSWKFLNPQLSKTVLHRDPKAIRKEQEDLGLTKPWPSALQRVEEFRAEGAPGSLLRGHDLELALGACMQMKESIHRLRHWQQQAGMRGQSGFSRATTGRHQVGLKQTGAVAWNVGVAQEPELQWRTTTSRQWQKVGRIAAMQLIEGLGSTAEQVAPLDETGVVKKEWGQMRAPLFEQAGLVEGADAAGRCEFLHQGSFARFSSLGAILAATFEPCALNFVWSKPFFSKRRRRHVAIKAGFETLERTHLIPLGRRRLTSGVNCFTPIIARCAALRTDASGTEISNEARELGMDGRESNKLSPSATWEASPPAEARRGCETQAGHPQG